MTASRQFLRKATLLVQRPAVTGNNPSAYVPGETLDLSELQFRFNTVQQDVESPNNCTIRVYNLNQSTVDKLSKFEYSQVILQAGYQDSYGVIFQGQIKQFRVGRENATTTYLDILAADGDLAYNFTFIRQTIAAAANTTANTTQAALTEFKKNGVSGGYMDPLISTGGVMPRGKVLFAHGREVMRKAVQSVGATWNISNGQINITALDGYLPGEAVVLNALTGMVGIPRQTENGLEVQCLLNPKLVVGGLVKIDNTSVNQLMRQPGSAPIPYNSYVGLQFLANVTNDGLYRLYVVEHDGDTRGPNWYTNLICLAIDPSTNKVTVK